MKVTLISRSFSIESGQGIYKLCGYLLKYLKEIKKLELQTIEMEKLSNEFLFDLIKNPLRVSKIKSDLFHFMLPEVSIPIIWKRPSIVTIYDTLTSLIVDKRNFFFRRYFQILMKVIWFRKPERIITISNFSKNEILRYLKYPEDKIKVVYEGVELEKYKPLKVDGNIFKKYGIPKDNKIVLYVGSEGERKNLPTLIKSFYKLKKRYPKVKLIKVGRPHPKKRKKLIDLINMLKLQNDIIFIDYVEEKDLPMIYNIADVYASTTIFEGGFALPALEAMACGCPVVISNIPPLVETIGNENSVMLDPFDTDGFANTIYDVLTDDYLRKKLIKNGLKRSTLFSWRKSAKSMFEIYKNCIDSL
jgi:glycosyltransferase involved in cell wall biosynthesis